MAQKYPQRLLPSREKYDQLTDYENCYLSRLADISPVEWENDGFNDVLKDDCVSTKKIKVQGNSCNLFDDTQTISFCSNSEDVKVDVDDRNFTYTEYIPGKNDNDVPSADQLNLKIKDNDFYLLRISDFHNIPEKYPFNIPSGTEEIRTFIFKVNKKPNLVNICHFEIDTYKDGEDKPLKDTSSKYIKDIKHIIRERITNKAIPPPKN